MTSSAPETAAEAAARWQIEIAAIHDLALADIQIAKTAGFLPVSVSLTAQVMTVIGVDITGFRHTVDTASVRHIYRHHGAPSEANRGQVPIVKADFLNLLEVVANPARITDGGIDKNNQRVLRIEKTINGFTLQYRVSVRVGKKRIAAVTLFKK